MIDRRSFLAAGASATAAAAAQAPPPSATEGAVKPVSPFTDPDFGFTALIALGGSYYRGGDPGKLLAIVSQIKAGDFESAWLAYHDAGVEARTLAEQAAAKRHNVSAREAHLWAASHFSAALRFLDGTKDPERMLGWAVLLAEDRQWFIQKAVGWWLRELSKRDPKRVRRFLKDHGEKLTGVARREAMKYLTATSSL